MNKPIQITFKNGYQVRITQQFYDAISDLITEGTVKTFMTFKVGEAPVMTINLPEIVCIEKI